VRDIAWFYFGFGNRLLVFRRCGAIACHGPLTDSGCMGRLFCPFRVTLSNGWRTLRA